MAYLSLVVRTRVIKMSLIQQIILTEFGGQCLKFGPSYGTAKLQELASAAITRS
jgi:hypothetical protein